MADKYADWGTGRVGSLSLVTIVRNTGKLAADTGLGPETFSAACKHCGFYFAGRRQEGLARTRQTGGVMAEAGAWYAKENNLEYASHKGRFKLTGVDTAIIGMHGTVTFSLKRQWQDFLSSGAGDAAPAHYAWRQAPVGFQGS